MAALGLVVGCSGVQWDGLVYPARRLLLWGCGRPVHVGPLPVACGRSGRSGSTSFWGSSVNLIILHLLHSQVPTRMPRDMIKKVKEKMLQVVGCGSCASLRICLLSATP